MGEVDCGGCSVESLWALKIESPAEIVESVGAVGCPGGGGKVSCPSFGRGTSDWLWAVNVSPDSAELMDIADWGTDPVEVEGAGSESAPE